VEALTVYGIAGAENEKRQQGCRTPKFFLDKS
jgi:hypothetical protein